MSTTTTTTTKSKSSPYSALQFHGVRTISAVSCIIVTSILVSFSIELKTGGFKIPWTFLIVLLTAVATLVSILLTQLIRCCGRLSPLFNLFLNIPLLILWFISLAIFSWNIYGALAHSCSTSNWGNDDGVTICSQFKALYSFVVFGALSQIAMIVLDVRARIAPGSGQYEKMNNDLKLEPYDSTHVAGGVSGQSSVHDEPYTGTNEQYQYRDEPGWRPRQIANENENEFVHDHQQQPREQQVVHSDYNTYGNQHGDMGTVRMDDFRDNHDVYQRPTYQAYHTGYENGQYGQRY